MTKKQKIKNYKILLEELQSDYEDCKPHQNLFGYCLIYDQLRRLKQIKTVNFDHYIYTEQNMFKTFPELEQYKPTLNTIIKHNGHWFDTKKFGKHGKKRINIVKEIISKLENNETE
jgi:hypothetical protein